jgi:hypothetical protein
MKGKLNEGNYICGASYSTWMTLFIFVQDIKFLVIS